jgi:hypothetical protein
LVLINAHQLGSEIRAESFPLRTQLAGGEMASKTYRLKIAREGTEFEAEGDKQFVMEMLKRFSPIGVGTSSATQATQHSKHGGKSTAGMSTPATKTISIREFIQKFGFTKHTDITLAFGYYLEKYAGVSAFTPADINNCYYEAKLEKSNTSQMVIQNIKRGFMMPSNKKGEGRKLYTLTSTGENFIASKVSGTSS